MRLGMLAKTIVLLICSNAFMNAAWYGHLKFRGAWLPGVILVSWLIALPEYALQVPANRIGAAQFSPTQLKIIQEVISVSVFVVFAWIYFREMPTWRTVLAFALIVGAVFSCNRPEPIHPMRRRAQPRWIAYPRETRYNRSSRSFRRFQLIKDSSWRQKDRERFATSRSMLGKWFGTSSSGRGFSRVKAGPWKPTSAGVK